MEKITEKDNVQAEWYKAASKQTIETLPDFLNGIMNNYSHDYGTICHALASGAIATSWAMNNHKNGGISGFQAGAVMWEFIRNWPYSDKKCGLKIVDYDNFLYPQYEDKFQKIISKDTFEAIQKQAVINIEEADKNWDEYLIKKAQFDIDLAEYIKKYPDYNERPEYYNHLSMGNSEQWKLEHEKAASGFEFAPSEPFVSIKKLSRIYLHWQEIASGIVPFGYTISGD